MNENLYLYNITFPSEESETGFRWGIYETCFNSIYPFGILSQRGLRRLDFEPITILYGGNGSGKTTALNIIAEKIRIARVSEFNKSCFFDDYVNLCDVEMRTRLPKDSKIITSDDVFDYMLNIRNINNGVDEKRTELFEDYYEYKYKKMKFHSLDDYDELKKMNNARRNTKSGFVRTEIPNNIREYSNGESALMYFNSRITEDALYLLDEPENSLSPDKQIELADFLINAVRFNNCQLIISTHSPFLLSLKGTKIYDFSENPVDIKKWTELENVRTYFDFFMKHKTEIENS